MNLQVREVTQVTVSSQENHNGFYGQIQATFTCEHSKEQLHIPAFYLGNHQWGVHFSPTTVGVWRYIINDLDLSCQLDRGIIHCQEGEKKRLPPLSVKQQGERSVFFQGEEIQQPFLLCAYECNWLFALWMKDKAQAQVLIEKIIANRFNAVVVNLYAHSCTWTKADTVGRLVPPPKYCWGGTNEAPEFSQLNVEFFKELDGLYGYLQEKGLYTMVYFFVFNKNVKYPTQNSPEETMYLQQVTARYQAFSNIIWIYGKESFHNPNKENILYCLELIQKTDGYRRLISNHDDRLLEYHPKHQALTDFLTIQHHSDFFEYSYRQVRESGKPVFHGEFGYESGATLEDITYGVAQNIEEFLYRGWRVAFAGASICYYYTYTAWDVIRPQDTPAGYDMFRILHEFFQQLDWWNYSPKFHLMPWGNHLLQKNGEETFIILANMGGSILSNWYLDEYDFQGQWLDPYTGRIEPISEKSCMPSDVNPVQAIFRSPFRVANRNNFAVLQLTAKKKQEK